MKCDICGEERSVKDMWVGTDEKICSYCFGIKL